MGKFVHVPCELASLDVYGCICQPTCYAIVLEHFCFKNQNWANRSSPQFQSVNRKQVPIVIRFYFRIYFAQLCPIKELLAFLGHHVPKKDGQNERQQKQKFKYSKYSRKRDILALVELSDSNLKAPNNDDECFCYHSWRNNVVVAFETLSSFNKYYKFVFILFLQFRYVVVKNLSVL